ncbi:hypothetical protein TNIN_219801 [Trichonephila inaurata madagascariensis]|uniref:Uncharacterized protein n=1 Tax=Trichonephila inaurata madagascariensis TaxID=2747483 RepID=A0A8X7CCK5_9ARAC|nr:hypothetical protein TNIN_219801 [Trichonephila inaurata madagascariensis]
MGHMFTEIYLLKSMGKCVHSLNILQPFEPISAPSFLEKHPLGKEVFLTYADDRGSYNTVEAEQHRCALVVRKDHLSANLKRLNATQFPLLLFFIVPMHRLVIRNPRSASLF